ncbi:MAG: hypothetical protein IPG02_14635 [Ignavibacteria bacterium]|jgi:hypothetical protein|nr:hypothetical protein [Ignavibacteria bacterium]MBK9229024.1 hypothetical protein [Ignavibacteria bacterium]
MNDTNPKAQLKLDEMYSQLSPEEKFRKMLSMCRTVREIIVSQLPSELSEDERRKRLFEIYYSQDFSKEDFEKWKIIIFAE